MTTLIFIHGTGVRQPAYDQTFKLIEKKIGERKRDIKVVPCFWGEDFGSKLNSQGKSVPLYDETLEFGYEEKEEKDILLWEQLYINPLYELALFSLNKSENDGSTGEQPDDKLDYLLQNLNPSDELQDKLEDGGIAEIFGDAIDALIRSDVYKPLEATPDSPTELRDAIARAIVAIAIQKAQQQEINPPIVHDFELRDEVVELLSSTLGNKESGLGEWILKPLYLLAYPGTTLMKRKRGKITEAISPIPCDILLYQTRGKNIRDFIREIIEKAEPPVVLLAHSLGGIACVDLLVEKPMKQVKLLVTVGSQAPFLYEINALYSLENGQPLPDDFPEWLNIYDLRDFLSYVGEEIFPDKIQDVKVDNKQPFPQSHSAYWSNFETWDAIIERLP